MSFNMPIWGVEYVCYVTLESQASPGSVKTNPTLASGDVKISKDGGAETNLNTTPSLSPASGRHVKVTVSATEMQADDISILFADASGAEWYDLHLSIQPMRLPASTVNDASFSPTTTAFEADLTEATDDHYNDLFIYFLTGANSGESRKILDYSGSNKRITLATALTDAPADGDKFLILGRSE